jgi:hypothetical protein
MYQTIATLSIEQPLKRPRVYGVLNRTRKNINQTQSRKICHKIQVDRDVDIGSKLFFYRR